MTEPQFSPARSEAIRSELIRIVDLGRPPRWRRPLAGVALVVAGVLAGGGGVAATAQLWDAQPYLPLAVPVIEPTSNPGVPAPAGHSPGQPIVSLIGQVLTYEIDGEERIIQLDPPEGATQVRVGLTCTTPGSTGWGFDPGGNNPSSTCFAADVSSTSASSWMDFDLDDDTAYPQHDLFYVQPVAGATSIVTLQYLTLIETAWVVNAAGETCGVGKPGFGEPDLVGVVALTPTGEYVEGYARRTQLLYPNGVDIPAYECDGVTQVGTFHVG